MSSPIIIIIMRAANVLNAICASFAGRMRLTSSLFSCFECYVTRSTTDGDWNIVYSLLSLSLSRSISFSFSLILSLSLFLSLGRSKFSTNGVETTWWRARDGRVNPSRGDDDGHIAAIASRANQSTTATTFNRRCVTIAFQNVGRSDRNSKFRRLNATRCVRVENYFDESGTLRVTGDGRSIEENA